jgi:hypothetical protein
MAALAVERRLPAAMSDEEKRMVVVGFRNHLKRHETNDRAKVMRSESLKMQADAGGKRGMKALL